MVEPAEAPIPPWAAELAEQLHKVTRSQARGQVQVEGLERKVEAGFADLRQQVAELARAGAGAQDLDWSPLLDSLDGIAEAVRVASAVSDPLAAGLRGIGERLAAFASRGGLTRLDATGVPPDGRYFRVVGTEECGDVTPGAILKVVRAAVIRGDRLIREGECVIGVGQGGGAEGEGVPAIAGEM